MTPAPADAQEPALFDQQGRPAPWTHELHGLGDDDPRSRGQRDAVEAASRSWRADAVAAIEDLAARSFATGEPFTAEQVHAICGPVLGPSQNAMGGLFAAAAKAGLIRVCGYTIATRQEAHGRVLRQWVGTGRGA